MRKLYLLLILSLFFAGTLQTRAQYNGINLSYDGVDDIVTLPAGIVSSVTGDFTIEAYVLWTGTNNSFPRILEFGNDPNNFIFLTAAIPFGATGPRFAIVSGGVVENVDAGVTLVPGQYNHIAVTVDDLNNLATIYINGVVAGTSPFTFHLSDLGSTSSNWLGGKGQFIDPFFSGYIEELRISNNLRYTANFTPSTVQFTTDANTVALYHFNEGSGQTTADATGNFNGILGATVAAAADDPTWIFGSVLPIRLSDFTVTVNTINKTADIRWTASLDQSSEFVLERSNDGVHFNAIYSLNRPNGSNGSENFSYRDNNPLPARSYYRLKATETGSAPIYSRIIPVNFSGKDELLVYPNPVRSTLQLELVKPFTGEIEIRLMNASGSVVYQQKIKSENRREFQVNRTVGMVSGTYLLEVTKNGIKQSKMIVFQ